jgi:hypothetical protein
MAPVRFQVLNLFKKHIRGREVTLEIPDNISGTTRRYKAKSMGKPIEKWCPILDLDEAAASSTSVHVASDQHYRISVETQQEYCPLISIDLQGEVRIVTLRMLLRSYWVSWSDFQVGLLQRIPAIPRSAPISLDDTSTIGLPEDFVAGGSRCGSSQASEASDIDGEDVNGWLD